MTEPNTSTVASADIARLAGVGRAAVSNWRRRFADFPAPVGGTAASPLYRLADVEGWLRTHGRAADITPLDRVWQDVRSQVDDLGLAGAVGRLGGLFVLLARAPQVWTHLAAASDDEFPRALHAALTAHVPELLAVPADVVDASLVTALRRAGTVAGETDPRVALRFLIGRFHEATARRVPATPEVLADLVAELGAVADRAVLDPACGTGAFLVAARAHGAARLAGQDTDPTSCRIAATRLLVDGGAVEVAVGDSLRDDGFPGRLFGAVVCEPPFGERSWGQEELGTDLRWQHGLPPRGEPELAWVQHCLSHAEPGGRVVVVMPAAAADRRSGRRIRRNLVRSGALRAVIGFPGEVGRSVDVWVLQRPRPQEPPPPHLLFVVAEPGDAGALWRRFVDGEPADGPGRRSVAPVDLLDDEVDLSPARHVVPSAAGDDVAALRRLMEDELRRLPAVPRLTGSAADSSATDRPTTTVGDLVRAAAVEVLQAPVRTAVDGGDVPVLTARDLAASRGPTGRTAGDPALVVLRAGDVVVPMLAGRDAVIRVISDDEAGAVLGPRLLCLRPDPARLDPHLLAGCLRAAGAASSVRTATSLSRSDIRRISLPLLPVDEQRELGAAFAALVAFDEALSRCVAAGDAYLRAATAALAEGRVGPEP
jgi:hypothetical protein